MCCFSQPVKSVANTRIFARNSGLTHQFLAYEMTFSASEDLAMILPIPVAQPAGEKAMRFIDLEKYPTFFKALESGFPKPPTPKGGLGGGAGAAGSFTNQKLTVETVGSFEASFVPSINDFDRLDERFRLPTQTWDNLPQYQAFGFAVFKLKMNSTNTHPMAFEFPRSNQTRLFFPTVHIHDGQVHSKARFDHTLYAQFPFGLLDVFKDWTESMQPAGMFMDISRCNKLLDENAHAFKRVIRGVRKNEDILA